MNSDDGKVAGALLFFGGLESIVFMIVAEALYPGYSIAENYISDLGVGSTAMIFNTSMVLLGAVVLIGAYFLHKTFRVMVLTIFLVLAGVGAAGVGVFPEDMGVLHGISALLVFLFGGLSAVVSYKVQNPPLSYFSVVLGAVTLVALVLFMTGTFVGLGPGGMERMIAYPPLLWGVAFGGYLMGSTK
ncbi:MAG: DUF998 domain-containing protein [Theionarchaea archaeon]|nr:DUF998 domain-containing protein [Theionarchaea archaeon]MBU7001665.1 DUF998 domain-containing protein [Theionarchaea archaeon]MBU7022131.1 DUF998 domain-containing protein [Theionarchaea archaeon]